MKKLFIGLLTFTLVVSFLKGEGPIMKDKIHLEKEKKILLAKDSQVSTASAENGILKAFFPFMTEHSILLPEKGHPIKGKTACQELIKQVEEKGWEGKLQWEPLLADVSAAGDLGYTYGRFERPGAAAADSKKVNYGYYATIWQKDAGGNWKIAFSQGLVLLKNLKQKPPDQKIDLAKLDDKTRQVVSTEHAFAKYSVENGAPQAFYRFIADSGMALAAVGPPRTKETYEKILAAMKEKGTTGRKSTLEWEPIFSFVSTSGDMAYNYGPYKYTVTDDKGVIQEGHGYFVTVWKKQSDNSWKFVIDGGNQY